MTHLAASSLLTAPDSAAASAAAPEPVVVLFLDHTAALSGGEIALLRLLEALEPQQVRPIVLLAAPGPLVARLEELGVQTVIMPLPAHVREMRKDRLGFGAIRRLRAVVSTIVYGLRVARFARRHRVQIIHANSLKSDIYGGLAGIVARIPVIWHVRDHINPSYLPRPAVAVFRFLAGHIPSYVVANSQSTLTELHLEREHRTAIVPSGLRLRTSVVHDGLTTDEMTGEPVSTDAPEAMTAWHSPVRIGIIGRIARWKGQHVFLEAAAEVLRAGHAAEFWIVGAPLFGEEAYEQELQAQVEQLRLRAQVFFKGFQENVPATIRELDIVVHASISPEPFGQVVIEGMAEGRPVIATDAGGVREIITTGKNGLLVPMGDAGKLTGAIISLLHDPSFARRLGVAGYRWVRRHFTAAQSARKIERVYRTILKLEREGSTTPSA